MAASGPRGSTRRHAIRLCRALTGSPPKRRAEPAKPSAVDEFGADLSANATWSRYASGWFSHDASTASIAWASASSGSTSIALRAQIADNLTASSAGRLPEHCPVHVVGQRQCRISGRKRGIQLDGLLQELLRSVIIRGLALSRNATGPAYKLPASRLSGGFRVALLCSARR